MKPVDANTPQGDPTGLPSDILLYLLEDVHVIADFGNSVADHKDSRVPNAAWRSYIRAVSAYLEGVITAAKFRCIAKNDLRIREGKSSLFTDAELVFLRETPQPSYRLDSKGVADVTTRPLAVRFRDNIRFAVAMFARADGFTVDFGGKGWAAVAKFIDIRDRVTHPRDNKDLAVDDSLGPLCLEIMNWVGDILAKSNAATGADREPDSPTKRKPPTL